MALQKLPRDIQSLFCSSQLCSYKRAVEELVYNALDADSTSIAIRINIEENSIQVIDNGHGIVKNDFNLLGQKHATSKCVDLATLKSAPNKYGFRGLSLSSIIDISKTVKITSRCPNSEDTWVKTFYNGKEETVCEASQRPSKGTTVDIKGFLYNLKIQKKAIESLNELNDIKNFLEQLSLVHNNISVSLRDDAKNEIIFKLYKNRDIYQTLSSVFEIGKEDLQELRVEKGEYKVTAYIGKRDKETSDKRWIYLNKKLLLNSKINKLVNDNLIQTLKLNLRTKKKVKSKNPYNQEEEVSKNGLPFYFLFITCPYYDYDLNITSKQTVVEFKQWDQINKLIEKLVRFYAGDMDRNKTPIKKTIKDIDKVENTRDEVKKIMERILGNNQRKIGISQMQRGIKGKITKRKSKRQTAKLSLSKVIPKNKRSKDTNLDNEQLIQKNVSPAGDEQIQNKRKLINIEKLADKVTNVKTNKARNNKNIAHSRQFVKRIVTPKKTAKTQIQSKVPQKHESSIQVGDDNPITIKDKREKLNPGANKEKLNKLAICSKKTSKLKRDDSKALKNKRPILDNLVKKFMDDPNGSVKKRCEELSKKVKEMVNLETRNNRQAFVNETVQYSDIVKNNKNYSVRQKIDEIVIHKYIPKPIGLSLSSYDGRTWYNTNKSPQQEKDNFSSYDLLRTVIRTKETNTYSTVYPFQSSLHSAGYSINPKFNDGLLDTPTDISIPKLTYESHNYEKYINKVSHEYGFFSRDEYDEDYDNRKKTVNNMRFITTQSKDNFLIPWAKDKTRRKNIKTLYAKNFEYSKDYFRKHNKSMSCASSYTIDFSRSNEKTTNNFVQNLRSKSITEPIIHGTYTIDDQTEYLYENNMSPKNGCTYTIIDDTPENINDIRNTSEHRSVLKTDISNHQNYTDEEVRKDLIQNNYDNNNVIELDDTNSTQNIDVVFFNDIRKASEHQTVIKNNRALNRVNYTYESVKEDLIQNNYDHDNLIELYDTNNTQNMNGVFVNDTRNFSKHQNENKINRALNRVNYTYENQDVIQNNYDHNNIIELDETSVTQNMNVVFVSKSQEIEQIDKSQSFENVVIPLELCETVHSCEDSDEPTNVGRKNDSLFNDDFEINSSLCDRNVYMQQSLPDLMDLDEILLNDRINEVNTIINDNILKTETHTVKLNDKAFEPTCLHTNENQNHNDGTESRFIFKDRLRFVPKGMSQIFKNYQTKNLSNYNVDQDYFKKTIYDKFADNVRENAKIYEPEVQNVKELATRAVDKVKNKLSKDHAFLIFDGESLKNAKILAQIDCKFIAAKLTAKTYQSLELSEYLILFDQHAVHERIRLENNLADYLNNDQWKSTVLDEITIKLSKDEILYLHNFKDKFTQLGLDWTMHSSGEICVKAIPEAILGKNPRQVDIVMKSVKNLIVEEINTIKAQSGCISLYPKAIMELVFSEACRYAIKFGDRLSINECVELLKSLSECKTPFQCAHGRPVMAVLMELNNDVKKYTVNMSKITNWTRRRQK